MIEIKRHSLQSSVLHAAVEHGDYIYLSGVVASDLSQDMFRQTSDILRQIEARLKEHGLDKSRILSATAYITDMGMKSEMNAAWMQFFEEEHLPARATIGVTNLGPRVLIEIQAVAGR